MPPRDGRDEADNIPRAGHGPARQPSDLTTRAARQLRAAPRLGVLPKVDGVRATAGALLGQRHDVAQRRTFGRQLLASLPFAGAQGHLARDVRCCDREAAARHLGRRRAGGWAAPRLRQRSLGAAHRVRPLRRPRTQCANAAGRGHRDGRRRGAGGEHSREAPLHGAPDQLHAGGYCLRERAVSAPSERLAGGCTASWWA